MEDIEFLKNLEIQKIVETGPFSSSQFMAP